MPDQGKVAIFWDYENCSPPLSSQGYAIVNAVQRIAHVFGRVMTFKSYLDMSVQPQSLRSTVFRSELQSSGVSMIDCPHIGKKDVVDKMILVDMLAFAIDHHSPATVILIAGDRDYAYAISTLRLRQYTVVLIVPSAPNIPESLVSQASVVIDWNYAILRKRLETSTPPVRQPYPVLDDDILERLVREICDSNEDPAVTLHPTATAPAHTRRISAAGLLQPSALQRSADNDAAQPAPTPKKATASILPETLGHYRVGSAASCTRSTTQSTQAVPDIDRDLDSPLTVNDALSDGDVADDRISTANEVQAATNNSFTRPPITSPRLERDQNNTEPGSPPIVNFNLPSSPSSSPAFNLCPSHSHTTLGDAPISYDNALQRTVPTAIPSSPASTGISASIVEPVRHFAACNLCDSTIVGDRFKCVDCPDFDTCSACFKITGEQHPNHGFVQVSKTSDLMMRNTLTKAVTHGAACDSCKKIIRGVRYKCMHPSCPDIDLCQDCEALPIPVHPPVHPLLKIKAPATPVPTVHRIGLGRSDATSALKSTNTSSVSAIMDDFIHQSDHGAVIDVHDKEEDGYGNDKIAKFSINSPVLIEVDGDPAHAYAMNTVESCFNEGQASSDDILKSPANDASPRITEPSGSLVSQQSSLTPSFSDPTPNVERTYVISDNDFSGREALLTESVRDRIHRLTPPHFLPLIYQLLLARSKGIMKPTRSMIDIALIQHDNDVYARAGVTAFEDYALQAQKASIVELGGQESQGEPVWIALHPNLFTEASTPSTAHTNSSPASQDNIEDKIRRLTPPQFLPLIAQLLLERSKGNMKPGISTIAVALIRAGMTSFWDYVTRAKQASLIELGGWESSAWIGLHPDLFKEETTPKSPTPPPPYSSSSPAPQDNVNPSTSSAIPPPHATTTNSSTPPLPAVVDPLDFQPLITCLTNIHKGGMRQPLRSTVGRILGPAVYSVGVVSMQEYLALALDAGIVEIGGANGLEWVRLHPDVLSGKRTC